MKSVLIVANPKNFKGNLNQEISCLSGNINLIAANCGAKTIEILRFNNIDLVLVELASSGNIDLELIAYMSVNFSLIPVIIISACNVGEMIAETLENLNNLGAVKLLQHSFEYKNLDQIVNNNFKKAKKKSYIINISVSIFLQLIEVEQKTAFLKITNNDSYGKGYLYFNNGVLYDAASSNSKRKEAALDMISWNNTEIQFKKIPGKKIKRRINSTIKALILESMGLEDETTIKNEKSVPETKGDVIPVSARKEVTSKKEASAPENKTISAPVANRGSVVKALKEILTITDTNAAIIITRNGTIVESAGALSKINLDLTGIAMANVIKGMGAISKKLSLKIFQTMTLESSTALIMFTKIGNNFLLLIGSDPNSLGIIRVKLKKQIPALAGLF